MALLLFLHSGKRSELISRLFFMPYRTEREIQSLMSVKVQAPFGARVQKVCASSACIV